MIVNGCTETPGSMSMAMRTCPPHKAVTPNTSCGLVSRSPTVAVVTSLKLNKYMRRAPNLGKTNLTFQATSQTSSLLQGEHGRFASFVRPKQTIRVRGPLVPKASKTDIPTSFRHPPMTKKPRWWWRTLACIPYLMPLHEAWLYAETASNLHSFIDAFEFLTMPFFEFVGQLPSWFLMAYFFLAYLGIVRRKEWPHFFRFHIIVGMLLEIALQVIGTISQWMPGSLYWGKFGMHFWTAVFFGFLFTVLECMRCSLCGQYADVPFVRDAAYIQIPYD